MRDYKQCSNGLVFAGGVAFPSMEAAEDAGYSLESLLDETVTNDEVTETVPQYSIKIVETAKLAKLKYEKAKTGMHREHITVPELRELAKDMGMKGYYRMHSGHLFNAVQDRYKTVLHIR